MGITLATWSSYAIAHTILTCCYLTFICFNLYLQSFATVNSLRSFQTATSSINSTWMQNFVLVFSLGSAKALPGDWPLSHTRISCSFLWAIHQYIDRPERSRWNKMFQLCGGGVSIKSRVTKLIEVIHTLSSFIWRQEKWISVHSQRELPLRKGRK